MGIIDRTESTEAFIEFEILSPTPPRPRIGAIRRGVIDLRAMERPEVDPVPSVLDVLYEDFQPIAETLRTRRLKSRPDVASPEIPLDRLIHPIAISLDSSEMTLWCAVDDQAMTEYRKSGRMQFGHVLHDAPVLPFDGRIVQGDDLAQLCDTAQKRHATRMALKTVGKASQKRSFNRKVGLTVATMGLFVSLLIGDAIGPLLVATLLASLFVIFHYTMGDGRWLSIDRLLASTRQSLPASTWRERKSPLWCEIERAILDHHPEGTSALDADRKAIEHLDTIALSSSSPALHERIAIVKGSLNSLLEAYRRTAAISLPHEIEATTREMAVSISALSQESETIRQTALRSVRSDFDDQRRYIEARGEHVLLNPIR